MGSIIHKPLSKRRQVGGTLYSFRHEAYSSVSRFVRPKQGGAYKYPWLASELRAGQGERTASDSGADHGWVESAIR